MRQPTWTLLAAVLVAASGCDGSSPVDPTDNGTPLVPGWLTLVLSSPHDDDGGILFTVSGGPIADVEPLIDGFFTATEAAGTWTVLSTADFTDGPVARIFVPDVQAGASLQASVAQAAARETYVQRDVSGYALTIVPE
jgi:hypothetical protein